MRFWTLLAPVFVVALVVRIAHVLSLADAPFFWHLLGDAQAYDEWARRLADGDWLGRASGVFYQAPLYPYVLGAVYALVGANVLVVRLLQAAVGAVSCSLVALAVDRWFGRRGAVLAGLFLAFYAPAIFLDGLIQKSVLDGLLMSGLVVVLAWAGRPGPFVHCALLGAVLGVLTLNRENALLLLPVLALVGWDSGGRRLDAPAVVVLTAALMLAPAAIRNRAVGGEWHLTTSQLGPNFYIGNSPAASGTYVPLRPTRGSFEFERRDATALAEADLKRGLGPSEVSRYWLGKGLDWIRQEPGAWLRLTGRKLLLLVNSTEAADTEDLATHAERSPVLRAAAPLLHFGVLAPLAVLGAWITRGRWRELWPLYVVTGVFAASVVLFYVLDRYRYPLVPLLAVFAGAAFEEAGACWARAVTAERLKIVGVTAVAAVLCQWPLLSVTDMRAATHYNVGSRLHADGLDTVAEAEYRRALDLQPTLAIAHSNLCALLSARGAQSEAQAHCREAVHLNPLFADAYVNLGMVFAAEGRTDEAVDAFAEGVRLDPRDAGAHYNLGRALASAGRGQEAVAHLRESIRLDPAVAAPHNTLGALLCSEGRLEEGIAHLKTALRLDPTSPDAANNLAHALDVMAARE